MHIPDIDNTESDAVHGVYPSRSNQIRSLAFDVKTAESANIIVDYVIKILLKPTELTRQGCVGVHILY